jgi:P pilus assembly chaperone PapD
MRKGTGESNSPGCARVFATIVLIVYGLLGALPSVAAGFSINPLRVYLDPGHTTESIQVRSDQEDPLTMQLRAYVWRQDDQGQDLYEPTDELIFFPKLLTFEPGQTRMIRVGVRGAPPEGEHSYRIYFEELPGAEEVPAGFPSFGARRRRSRPARSPMSSWPSAAPASVWPTVVTHTFG